MTTIDQAAATYFATLPSIPSDSTRHAFRAGFEARTPVAVATSDAELLPCPFCGSAGAIWLVHRVICQTCDCEGPSGDDDLAANIAGWNRRAALPIDFKQATDQGGWLSDEKIIERCKAAGIRWIEPDLENDPPSEGGFPGSFDMVAMVEMRSLLAAPSAPAPSEPDLIGAIRKLPMVRAREIDGEESDGTPISWRDRPFVSLTQLERLLSERAPTLLGVADGDAVGGKSGGAA